MTTKYKYPNYRSTDIWRKGELTADEVRIVRAAIRWANSHNENIPK